MRHSIALFLLFAAGCIPATADVQLKLPEGFQATVIARDVGSARHIVVHSNGDVYVSLQDPRNGGAVLALRDSDGDGTYERREYFGQRAGTALAIHGGYLYHQGGNSIERWKLPGDGALVPAGDPETVVAGFEPQAEHQAKGITFDGQGRLYVTVGAPSNSCQEHNRVGGSRGIIPCPQLERHAGVWRFPNGEPGQVQRDGEHVATGLRHPFGLDYHRAANGVWLITHGRDQLGDSWDGLYTEQDNAEQPAEEFHKLVPGLDAGWPYTYWDPIANVRRIAPEYGGDGVRTAREGRFTPPLIGFPAHWAPNDLVVYTGGQFPASCRNGVFIAFHGSWNRAPLPQQGYKVVFVPMDAQGNITGEWRTFADNFDGSNGRPLDSPGRADHRPCGLAVGPDGALFVTDDKAGYIWRIDYAAK